MFWCDEMRLTSNHFGRAEEGSRKSEDGGRRTADGGQTANGSIPDSQLRRTALTEDGGRASGVSGDPRAALFSECIRSNTYVNEHGKRKLERSEVQGHSSELLAMAE